MPTGCLLRFLAESPGFDALLEPASWSAIKKSAGGLGVATLAARVARSRLPAEERAWCDAILASSWGQHEQSLRDLAWIVAVLEEDGIRPLALKGPMLACRHYDPPFLRRPSRDLDLAVRKNDLDRASQSLVRAGYKLRIPVAEAKLRSHHVELSHRSKPPVELHFRLSHGAYGIPVDEFFDRAVPGKAPGGNIVWVLDPADEIIQLALHFVHSSGITLFHLCEIHRIWTAAYAGIRQEVIRRAAKHHITGVFAFLDVAFRARWGEPLLPGDLQLDRTWLHWRLDEEAYRAFERRFVDDGSRLAIATRISRRWLLFQKTDRPADALRLALISARTALLQLSDRISAY